MIIVSGAGGTTVSSSGGGGSSEPEKTTHGSAGGGLGIEKAIGGSKTASGTQRIATSSISSMMRSPRKSSGLPVKSSIDTSLKPSCPPWSQTVPVASGSAPKKS